MHANIRTRLALLFAPKAVGSLAVGLSAMRTMSASVDADEETYSQIAKPIESLVEMSVGLQRARVSLRELLLSNGLTVAQGTSESFATIVGNVVKAADRVGEVAAASKEQAAGIAQITQGLTQRNTATAEEAASAAAKLTANAEQIDELFARFRVGDAASLREPTAECPLER